MTSPALKSYHERVNIPELRKQTAEQLEALAAAVRSEDMDREDLERALGHLSDISYRDFDNRFAHLWHWLRGLKVALRDET